MTKIDQIAQAFAQGVKFAENLKLAMDAAKGKDDEDGHWVTVGEGEEARPVFIKDKKKAAKKAESKKKNDQIFRYTPRKEFIDMFKSTDYTQDKYDTLKIWYKDQTFKHFDYEDDPKELARALRRSGIKAIVWTNEGDVGYYGSPDDIIMRNVNTDETKPLAEVQKDAGVDSLWVVDDVIDNNGSKKTESKPAQQRNEESPRETALRINREQTARANRSQEDIEAAHQVFLKFDRSAMRTMTEVSGVTFPAQQRMRDVIRGEIPGTNANVEKSIKDSLRQIRGNIDAFNKTMGKIQSRIAKAASDGKIGEGRADAELRDYRRYYKTFADYIVRASKQMNNLDHTTNDGHQEDREVLSKIANLTSEMVKDATEWNNKQ